MGDTPIAGLQPTKDNTNIHKLLIYIHAQNVISVGEVEKSTAAIFQLKIQINYLEYKETKKFVICKA
jgi:hypothetical protein